MIRDALVIRRKASFRHLSFKDRYANAYNSVSSSKPLSLLYFYTSFLGHFITLHGFKHHPYANYIQMYLSNPHLHSAILNFISVFPPPHAPSPDVSIKCLSSNISIRNGDGSLQNGGDRGKMKMEVGKNGDDRSRNGDGSK